MTAPHLASGRQGELYARQWLEARGLIHVCSNFRCRYGELDLVMRDGDCLAIVEVRYRRGSSHGGALLSISRNKRERIARSAALLLLKHPALRGLALRFDVMGLTGTTESPAVDWRKGAFVFDEA